VVVDAAPACTGDAGTMSRVAAALVAIASIGASLGASIGAAFAAQPLGSHQHGVVQLDIAVDANRISVQMSSPLDNLLGFERAPRNEAERARVAAMLAALKSSPFVVDPAGACRAGAVQLSSAALKLGEPDPAEQQAGHADLDASFEFECSSAARAGFIDTSLFERFAGIQRIDVQLATSRGQRKLTLTRPAQRIVLPR
jgi:hypothetical protein